MERIDAGASLKRRKEKENINKELLQNDKQNKRKAMKFDWQQTNSEITVRLFVGNYINPEEVSFGFTEDSCSVVLPDGRTWKCDLYREVLAEGMSVTDKGNKLILKMVKRIPEHWNYLERHEEEVKGGAEEVELKEEMEGQEKHEHKEKPIIEVPHIKHDFYEKAPDTLTVNIFVKNISKDALTVKFEETFFVVKFQTSDLKFLSINNGSGDDTIFLWKVNVKEAICPELCRVKLTPSKIEVLLRKQVPKRWKALEALNNKDEEASLLPVASCLPLIQPPSVTEVTSRLSSPDVDSRHHNAVTTSLVPKKETKPTCMVSPLNKQKPELVMVPGMTGLDNLGNTCFMNSVLQCLANTREFRDYFLDGYYRQEMNEANPLGMGGRLAECFAVLMKALWTNSHKSYAPDKLKILIGKKASQFTGFAQHDAQEFMAFLLDGLHEDLNRVKNKPYTENIDGDGRSDEVVAEESWKLYKKRNDSIVVDLFQGQYKSKLVCPDCNKVSITFDPFLYLSLPLPKKIFTRPVYFFSKDHHRKPIKHCIQLTQEATVEELKEKIALVTRTKTNNLRVFEVFNHKIYKFFGKGSTLPEIANHQDTIFVFEVLDEKLTGEPVLELIVSQRIVMPQPVTNCSNCSKAWPTEGDKLRRCTKCYRVGYCNQTCQKENWNQHRTACKRTPEPVGMPFIISLPESKATFTTLCRIAEAYSRYSVDVFQPPVQHSLSGRQSSERKSFDSDSSDTSQSLLSSSATVTSVTTGEKASEKSSDICSISDKSCSESDEKETCCSTEISTTEDSLPLTRVVFGHPTEESIERTLPHFSLAPVDQGGQKCSDWDIVPLKDKGEEPLNLSGVSHLAMDWKNDEKKLNYVMVQSKDLDYEGDEMDNFSSRKDSGESSLDRCLRLFTEPEVLSPQEAWYCPKCKDHREATKELSLWRLPPVLIIQLKRFSFKNLLFRDKIDKLIEFPVRGLDLSPYVCGPTDHLPVYDLYAVVNHHGSILGGHYTAFARCIDLNNTRRSIIDWRLFDDSNVRTVLENMVMTKSAYVLFYRQRSVPFTLPQQLLVARPSNKEQKQRENMMDMSGDAALPVVDSNIISDMATPEHLTEMEMVD